jgi:hypothetical protein
VDDSPCLRFFLEPTGTLRRRYEALRAYVVERRPLKEIAQQSGYSYNTLRDVIGDFRARCREDRIPGRVLKALNGWKGQPFLE